MANKIVFMGKTDSGDEVKLAVVRPSAKIESDGDKIFNSKFKEAITSGALLRAKLVNVLKEQGVWNDTKQTELDSIDAAIDEDLKKLKGGLKACGTLLEARKIAIDIRIKRNQRISLLSEQNALDALTCESQAENARFDYKVANCTVFADKGTPYYKNYEDYLSRRAETVSNDAASNLAQLLFDYKGFQASLPENLFLKKFNFADDDLNLIDSDGNLCSVDFKRIDKNGNYVLDDGVTICDENGLPIEIIPDEYNFDNFLETTPSE